MKFSTQFNPGHIYEVPSSNEYYEHQSPHYDAVPLVLGTALTAVLWAWFWWHVISKVGYRGLARKLWLVAMCIPPLPAATMLLLLALPWPVYGQLRRQVKAGEELEAELKQLHPRLKAKQDIESELNQLRHQIHRQ